MDEKIDGTDNKTIDIKSDEKDGTEFNDENDHSNKSDLEEEEEEVESDADSIITNLNLTGLYSYPVYAELCSYFNLFSLLLGIKPISFAKLDKIFGTLHNNDVDKELIDLHITLMRKIYLKSARADKWEASLMKFCSNTSSVKKEFAQLRRSNYTKLPFNAKLSLLKALCDSQFDYNVKFRENLSNTYNSNEIRIMPIGSDINGQIYYYQQDCDLNIRVWSSDHNQLDTNWSLRAKTEDELIFLISCLKSTELNKNKYMDHADDKEIKDASSIIDTKIKVENGTEILKDNTRSNEVIQMSEDEKATLHMENNRFVLWDKYSSENILNKKKTNKRK